MYALNYVYDHETESLSAVLRSLYLYYQQIQLMLKDESPNSRIICNQYQIFDELREITNLYSSSKCKEMLVDIGLLSILGGNLALSLFLVKYGFMRFPNELNDKCKSMVEILVESFNGSFEHPFKIRPAEYMRKPIQPDELLNLMRQREVNMRRFLMTFCAVIIISEYSTHDVEETNSELNLFNENIKTLCNLKFQCLNLCIDATTETEITYKDIEIFTATFIDPLHNSDVGKYLLEKSRRMFLNYYSPRSLKDLARCEIRANLRYSMTFPEQVNLFDIPVALKEFLLFDLGEIWLLLKECHQKYCVEQKMKSIAPLIRPILAVLQN